jgi:hypothetical protein
MGRYALEMPQLVDAHSQRDANLDVETRLRREQSDQVIQLELESKAPEHDFGREPGIAAVEILRFREQEVGGEATLMYTP